MFTMPASFNLHWMHICEPVEQPVKNHCGKDIQTQVHTKLFHGRKHLYLVVY